MDLQGYMGTSTRLHQYIYYSVKKSFFIKVNHIKQDLSSLVEMSIRYFGYTLLLIQWGSDDQTLDTLRKLFIKNIGCLK